MPYGIPRGRAVKTPKKSLNVERADVFQDPFCVNNGSETQLNTFIKLTLYRKSVGLGESNIFLEFILSHEDF